MDGRCSMRLSGLLLTFSRQPSEPGFVYGADRVMGTP